MNNDCEDFPQHLEKFFSNAEEIIYHGIKCSFLLKEATTEMFYLYKVTSATDTKTNKKPNHFPNTTSKWAYQTWFSLECSYFFIFWTRMLSQFLFKKNPISIWGHSTFTSFAHTNLASSEFFHFMKTIKLSTAVCGTNYLFWIKTSGKTSCSSRISFLLWFAITRFTIRYFLYQLFES